MASNKQKLAVQYLLENGGNKGNALRKAGYSESIVKNPHKVFNSPVVAELLNNSELNPIEALNTLNKRLSARTLKSMTFELFDNKAEHEQMTDDDIRDLLTEPEQDYVFSHIVQTSRSRQAYYWVPDNRTQLDAIEKVINLYGMYAPKRTEQKNTNTHVFSMAELRRKVEAEGLSVI